MGMHFQVYRRRTVRGPRWFWRMRGRNGRIVSLGGEGFVNRGDVLSIIDTIKAEAARAPVAEVER